MADRDNSPDTLFVTQDDHYNNEHAAQRQRLSSSRIVLPPLRYPGDGLDYRRPVMSGSGSGSGSGSNTNSTGPAQNTGVGVIDLTSDDETQSSSNFPRRTPAGEAADGASRAQRGPRFGRAIIDLADEDDAVYDAEDNIQRASHRPREIPATIRPNYLDLFPARAPTRTHPHPQFSNLRRPERVSPPRRTLSGGRAPEPRRRTEMEELHGLRNRLNDDLRGRLRAGGRADNENTRGHRSMTPYPNGLDEPIDLTGDDDDVVLVDARTRAGVNAEPPALRPGARSTVNDIFEGLNAGGSRLYNRLMAYTGIERAPHPAIGGAHIAFAHPPPGTFAAVDLNFHATAFDMGLGGNQPPPPKYEPPAAAAKGFTRSPGEDDVVVCPNCGDELAVNDDEKKAEVWIIKKCGHVSCTYYHTWLVKC